VRRLEVGVDHQHVERDVLGAEAGQQRRVVGLAVGEVAREPDAERAPREQRRRARERAQVGEAAGVVATVGEEVAVLVGALALGPHREAGRRVAEQDGAGVVEEVPAVAREQAVVEPHGPAGEVERAVPAAEVALRARRVVGVLADGVGLHLRRRRPGARRRRGRELGAGGDDTAPDAQREHKVAAAERAGAAAVADRHARRADAQRLGGPRHPHARRSALAADRVQRRAVLEAPVGRVLDPDEARSEHLEARLAVGDGRLGVRGGGRGERRRHGEGGRTASK
jgi:hypothetical protein